MFEHSAVFDGVATDLEGDGGDSETDAEARVNEGDEENSLEGKSDGIVLVSVVVA